MLVASENEMIQFWKKLAQEHKKLLIYWELGSWKTHLVKWFAQWIRIEKQIVQSPTYTYINIYENKLLHIDMYRLESFEDFIEKWILDEIWKFEYIAIEWPKFEENYIDDSWTKIQITKTNEEQREVKID